MNDGLSEIVFAESRALRVMEWADLNGDDLAGKLRLDPEDDAETLAVINDALLATAETQRLRYALGVAVQVLEDGGYLDDPDYPELKAIAAEVKL